MASEEFEREGVSPESKSKRAENVAVAWALGKKAELLQPKSSAPMLIGQVFDVMKVVNPDQVSDSTWHRNSIHLRNLRRLPNSEPIGTARPDQIDGRLASLYRNERQAEGAAPRTIAAELTFLIRLLRFGFEEAATVTGMNAMRLTKLPKIIIEEQQMIALTIDEFFVVLDATKKMRQGRDVTRRRLIFAVTTLLRKTPLMALRAEWIDLDDPWLDVPAAAQKGRRGEKRPLSVPLCGWAGEQLPNPLPLSGLVWANNRSREPTGNVTHTLNKLADEARVSALLASGSPSDRQHVVGECGD